ncbi:MAG: 2-oxoglutarate oxidoreductase, delta subunit, putative (EC [uncultured Campylobacterales bacterium]|uniref:2-oxoglutarate oxidoreductase, delta subunit, putative (EC) n=1 Tax=uncultured Campylobacterales bacterium TaxID=352960 RepID=A0A6S6TLU6_9BACT|nr:MAG: 2-oxoglutarate oxidoreductase, delta subunit, putative (EC [uncultured Campylobacterales bacterium]
MAHMESPQDTPVWVNTNNCKACNICVTLCPAGVLGMIEADTSILGSTISVDYPDSCIGCNACELSCPDFAIYVSRKKDFKFAKLSPDSKQRADQIVNENKCMSIKGSQNG